MDSQTEERVAPASFIQRSMWAAAQRYRNAPLNVMILPWRVHGALDLNVLQQAVTDLVRRHPTLRTHLRVNGGQLQQVVSARAAAQVQLHSVEQEEPDKRWQGALDLLKHQGRQALDMSKGDVFRPWLVRLSEQEHVLCLFVHHAMCDGWSSLNLINDLAALYAAELLGTDASLPAIEEQYADFASAQLAAHDSGAFATHLAYWKQELSEPPAPIALPTLVPRKGSRDWLACSPRTTASADSLAALRALAKARRVSVFSVLLSALAVLLHSRTGALDQLIGVPILGRWSPGAMRFVGCATNMLPARIRLEESMQLGELVTQVHATVRRLMAYGRVPLELVLREIHGPVVGGLPFPIWCQYRESTPPVIVDSGRLSFASMTIDRGTLLTELDVDMVGGPDGLECEFVYRPSLVGSSPIDEMMVDYSALLTALPRVMSQPLALVSAECRKGASASH